MGYTYADLHVGMSFRSPGRTIGESDLTAFAGLTGDFSELHKRGRKSLLLSKAPLGGVEASRAKQAPGRASGDRGST